MRRRAVSFALAAFAGASAFAPSVASAGSARILSHDASVNLAKREATFSLRFSELPDLFTADEFGRPAGSFQFEINPNWEGVRTDTALDDIRIVVRGDEVRFAGGELRVRNAIGDPDPDPAAGGWGALRGSVPLEVSGDSLRFTAGFDLLKETDGVFAYRVFTTEFGATVDLAEAHFIPLPPAFWAGALTLAGVAGGTLIRRLRAT